MIPFYICSVPIAIVTGNIEFDGSESPQLIVSISAIPLDDSEDPMSKVLPFRVFKEFYQKSTKSFYTRSYPKNILSQWNYKN